MQKNGISIIGRAVSSVSVTVISENVRICERWIILVLFVFSFDRVIDELYEGPQKEDMLQLQEKHIDNCVFYPENMDDLGSSTMPSDVSTPPDVSTSASQSMSSTSPVKNISTTRQRKTPTQIFQNASSTPPAKTTSTTPKYEKPTSFGQENVTTTTPGQNRSTARFEITSTEEKETQRVTSFQTSKPTVEEFITPSPTGVGKRCQDIPSLLLLFSLLFLINV